MKNKDRRKIQRRVNKMVKEANKCIEDDELWLGRFYVHQKDAKYCKYDDNSGGYLRVMLELVDRQTNYSEDRYLDCFSEDRFFASNLFWEINDFIIKDCKVWEEVPRPSISHAVDYRRGVRK